MCNHFNKTNCKAYADKIVFITAKYKVYQPFATYIIMKISSLAHLFAMLPKPGDSEVTFFGLTSQTATCLLPV